MVHMALAESSSSSFSSLVVNLSLNIGWSIQLHNCCKRRLTSDTNAGIETKIFLHDAISHSLVT